MPNKMNKIWLPVFVIGLSGCGTTAGVSLGTTAAGAGAGYLQGIIGAAQSGGPLTPITNIGNALTLQELANAHNTIYSAQQILNSTGPVTIAISPGTVVTTGPPAPIPIPPPPPPNGRPPSFPSSPVITPQ